MRIFFALLLIAAGVFYFKGDIWPPKIYSAPPIPLVQKAAYPPIQGSAELIAPIDFHRGKLAFLASYEVTALVLSRRDYPEGSDRQSEFIPVDLVLGWKRMSIPSVASLVSISQANRWYYSDAKKWPMGFKEFASSVANTHIIPANKAVEKQLALIKKGQTVTLKGYLVSYRKDYPNGAWWDVKSSLTRDDTGGGACEIVYVEHIIIY